MNDIWLRGSGPMALLSRALADHDLGTTEREQVAR